jgi:hypothetical protein
LNQRDQFRIETVNQANAMHVTHITPTGTGFHSAVEIWQHGNGASLRLYHENAEVGWLIDGENDAPNGGGIKVLIDSTLNDSDAVLICHKGLGAGIYAEIKNSSNSKHAIHAKTNGTGKAVYAEGDIESTKRIVAKGFSAYYEVALSEENIPANNLAVGDMFVVKDTDSGEFYICVKDEDASAKGTALDLDFKLKNP